MYRFLRLHYLLFLPSIVIIPSFTIFILSLVPFQRGDGVDSGFYGLLIAFFYLCFTLGQIVLYILIRTRPDVRLTRTCSSYDALLFTFLYSSLMILPFFHPGYDHIAGKQIPSIAARTLDVLFENSSDTIFYLLLLIVFVLYFYIFIVVVYERFKRTAIEVNLPARWF
jgi:hypothetical protein